jgi:hypothetical protein
VVGRICQVSFLDKGADASSQTFTQLNLGIKFLSRGLNKMLPSDR